MTAEICDDIVHWVIQAGLFLDDMVKDTSIALAAHIRGQSRMMHDPSRMSNRLAHYFQLLLGLIYACIVSHCCLGVTFCPRFRRATPSPRRKARLCTEHRLSVRAVRADCDEWKSQDHWTIEALPSLVF